MIPNEGYEDEPDLDDEDDDLDYVDFDASRLDDEEPCIVLCPRCEDHDMMSTDTVCHWCAREMWIHDNG